MCVCACLRVFAHVRACVCVCMACIVLITAEVFGVMSQDSYFIVRAWSRLLIISRVSDRNSHWNRGLLDVQFYVTCQFAVISYPVLMDMCDNSLTNSHFESAHPNNLDTSAQE